MKQSEMIEIPKTEYEKLKGLAELEEIDIELFGKVVKALKNFKEGKFKEWN